MVAAAGSRWRRDQQRRHRHREDGGQAQGDAGQVLGHEDPPALHGEAHEEGDPAPLEAEGVGPEHGHAHHHGQPQHRGPARPAAAWLMKKRNSSGRHQGHEQAGLERGIAPGHAQVLLHQRAQRPREPHAGRAAVAAEAKYPRSSSPRWIRAITAVERARATPIASTAGCRRGRTPRIALSGVDGRAHAPGEGRQREQVVAESSR